MKHNLLLVEDSLAYSEGMKDFLTGEGFKVRTASCGEDAIAMVRQQIDDFSFAFVDYHLPDMTGAEVIRQIQNIRPKLVTFALSGDETDLAHNNSLDSGAMHFLDKKISDAKLLGILHRHCREIEKQVKPVVIGNPTENMKLIASVGLVGASDALAEVARLILAFGPGSDSVLIRGPNGTGKELVARAIHQNSSRKNKPFIAVNVSAIQESLIESELFGYEKGAFTGAVSSRQGFFQAADGGTLFLDEIGDMPKHLQVKLLRVLQEKTITPVGSTKSRKVDFRIVAATNAPLEEKIVKNEFREDLFFRLNVLPIIIKPLRDRILDIPVLADAFVNDYNKENNTQKIILDTTCQLLQKFPWNGNVRELKHCIRLMASLSKNRELDDSILEKSFITKVIPDLPAAMPAFKTARECDEKTLIVKALQDYGTAAGAARHLGMSRSTLRDKVKKYGIEIQN